jgi:RimJ/RimL family protein N-acetyltransferase
MDRTTTESSSIDLQPILEGSLVKLRPLRDEDYSDLYAVASDPLIWEQHPERERYQEATFQKFFAEAMASKGALLAVDAATGRAIGSSRYFGYDPVRSEIEIGWTFLARSHWGGRYNGEMKSLMLHHAFGFVQRVVFLIGPDNVRSQRAVERIGGTRAGTRPDGRGGISVVYQITAGERTTV